MAIKAGKISGTKDEHGGWFVEPAELYRVDPPADDRNGAGKGAHSDTQYRTQHTIALVEAKGRAELAESRLADLKAALDELRSDRDAWRAGAAARNSRSVHPPAVVAKARRVMNEDRLNLAQMEQLRAELRPNLVLVLELLRRELDELRVDHELMRRELKDIQALLCDATRRNEAGRLWWFAVALVVACCGASHKAAQRQPLMATTATADHARRPSSRAHEEVTIDSGGVSKPYSISSQNPSSLGSGFNRT